MTDKTSNAKAERSLNFIEQIIENDLQEGKNKGIVYTRFPPEPNGYLHIGHAKSICLNFGLAQKYNGKTNLRFDDTNPEKEETEYVNSIMEDVRWLGFEWEGEPRYASDYFDQIYEWTVKLIRDGKAYIDEQTAEQISEQKGVPTRPGTESPYRNRPIEENMQLFDRMKNGEFKEGEMVLRAKIHMASPNMHMRDPIMYRILHKPHHRTGDKWCIYPMYDWAHGESDYIEGITHSVCTLEFEVHRPLYEWFLEQVYTPGDIKPRQIEFARLNLNYTVMSKRKLLELVNTKLVSGWDDPRMPTISGLRRRGYTPESLRNFADMIGIAKRDNVIDVSLLEFAIREDLNKKALRVMGVLNPLKVVLTNYPDGKTEYLPTENNPEDENGGLRDIPFSKELYIEQDDFMENPPKKYFRLSPGAEVRLKSAYIIKCESLEKDEQGNITTLYCTYDPDSKSGSGTEASKRKVKATIHWVSAPHAVDAEIRLYDRLFSDAEPDGHDADFKTFLNPDSLQIITTAKVEPALANVDKNVSFQFMRLGYFCLDKEATPGNLVFNRTVTLKDTWTKLVEKGDVN